MARSAPQTPRGRRPRIAHFAGANATIMNSPPLVTSQKARAQYGLPLLRHPDGTPVRFDVLRPQRLAAPVTVYVEQFSAHPLERDAAELYAPPDGYLDAAGVFHRERQGPDDVPVYEVTLRPEDGLYPLPYMARQASGAPWDDDCADPGAPPELARQPFYPDGSRVFEEIERFGIGEHGVGNLIAAQADVDFYRVLPPSGYTKGLPAALRSDLGEGDILPEVRGRDFFPYRPPHISASPPRPALAHVVNYVQRVLGSGEYDGAIWTQGSPRVEETSYWLNLLLDVTVPVCGNAAQRPHGMISADGDKNLVDSVTYLTSRIWADAEGRNRAGVVMVQDEQIFYSRDVQKGDARPGGYVATGGHGGIIGNVAHHGPVLTFLPARLHTYQSAVNVSRLPEGVMGVQRSGGGLTTVRVAIKDAAGQLRGEAMPRVSLLKEGNYHADHYEEEPEREADIVALVDQNLADTPLAGFVVEGLSPYGTLATTARNTALLRAVYSGMPVVGVGRGNHEGFTPPREGFIGGNNLTATKARLLLMACLLKLGSLPPAADPAHPTDAEREATRTKLAQYQEIFDTH
ncbi:MAG TPA: asparaginase domain-containing protein [Chloroflexota bacterium]|nr:asparaginase domain-containing protein [Chloroflexota bacterium]